MIARVQSISFEIKWWNRMRSAQKMRDGFYRALEEAVEKFQRDAAAKGEDPDDERNKNFFGLNAWVSSWQYDYPNDCTRICHIHSSNSRIWCPNVQSRILEGAVLFVYEVLTEVKNNIHRPDIIVEITISSWDGCAHRERSRPIIFDFQHGLEYPEQ